MTKPIVRHPTKFLWRHFHHPIVTSTMDLGAQYAAQYPNEKVIVTADVQTAGRGRYDRVWNSQKGNFYGTFVLPYQQVKKSPVISYGAALAVFQALHVFIKHIKGVHLSLKWPNDILLNDHKVAGILLDVKAQTLMIGIGVNLRIFPDKTPYPATSIFDATQVLITQEEFLTALTQELDEVIKTFIVAGFKPLRAAWLTHRNKLHDQMIIKHFDHGIEKAFQATFIDIDLQGMLVVKEKDSQKTRKISAADIFFKKCKKIQKGLDKPVLRD